MMPQPPGRDRARSIAAAVLVAVLMLGALVNLARVEAAPGASSSRPILQSAPGDSRAEPVPLGETAAAGPWRLTILEVVGGADATARVTAARALNGAPREGFDYVLVRVRAENGGDRALTIDGDDFGLTGATGLVRRFAGAIAPDPALGATVGPGEATEGWVVFGAPSDETSLLLIYDPLRIPGNWADGLFALAPDAAIPAAAAPVAAPNAVGADPGAPAGVNEPVVTEDWQIEVLEVLEGAAIFELVDFRTGALGVDESVNADPWLALRVRVTNVHAGGEPAFLPPTAFAVAAADGGPYPDVLRLTPPFPDVSAAYYPGASREGLVIFELTEDYVGTGLALVRFQPYRADPDPRFLTWG